MVFVLIFVGFSGCNNYVPDENNNNDESEDSDNNTNKTSFNISLGDSIIVDNVNFTFLRAYWAIRMSDGFKIYTIELSAKNIGSVVINKHVKLTKFENQKGDTFEPTPSMNTTSSFYIKPGETQMGSIDNSEDSFDVNFLPITKVYFTIDGNVDVVLNVS